MASEYEPSVAQPQKRSLPKNYRQIGEPGKKKIYLEDYVHTYLSKLSRPENYYARGAILFGRTQKTEEGEYLFISGASVCQQFELDLQETVFDETAWAEIDRIRQEFFPDLEIVGWFLSRMGFSTELNDRIIRLHLDYFSDEKQVLYIVDSLENEDAFYQMENYTLKKQKGYYIYYETNESMKNYMVAEKEKKQIVYRGKEEQRTSRRDAAVVRNYKRTLDQKKKEMSHKKPWWSPTNLVASVATAAFLLCAMYAIQATYHKQEDIPTSAPVTFTFEEATTEANVPEQTTTEQSTTTTETETTARSNAESNAELNTESKSKSTTEEVQDVFTQEEPDNVQAAWNYIGGYYTVQKGDTLAKISKKIYQSYDYIEAIAEANAIENVDQIFPGQVLEIPEMID